MDGIGLIQDLAIVLLAAGIAGAICRRFGLSVIVGYLVAGTLIGPYNLPFSFLRDVDRIQTLSQVGLVFLMFGIGLGLSISKMARIGAPTLAATGVGAVFMLVLTQALGKAIGWSPLQATFMAAMFMVSSSAVIAKVVGELKLTHERFAQVALSITVLEDIVAVVMLTVLGSQTGTGEEAGVSRVVAGMSAFVVLLVSAGLLMVPRLLRRLEARADPELQTIIVAGVLFLLALIAVKAGYSLALGAFLLGAIVAEIPQYAAVEKAFTGMRDLFSSVFFVAIGMMIELKLVLPVWPMVVGLVAFVMIFRPIATGAALIICGARPREARRSGLLLTPLGEFSFIIAQLGVSTTVLPASYYPVAVGASILTVLLMPLINRHSDAILRFGERVEPRWLQRTFDAYHNWIQQVQSQPTNSIAWKLVRGRLAQTGVEVLFVTGVMVFSPQLLDFLDDYSGAAGLEREVSGWIFWSIIAIIALIPIVAIWRNLAAIAMIVAESLAGSSRLLPAPVVRNALIGLMTIGVGVWIYALVPFDQLGLWGWGVIAIAAAVVVAIFSRKLIYWHSEWQTTMREVLAEDPRGPGAAAADAARGKRQQDLEQWDVRLTECVIPDNAAYAGTTLLDLAIPARFGCAVLELERNGHVITAIRPDLRVYPGDKLLLMGQDEQIAAACNHLLDTQTRLANQADEFRGSILETFVIPDGSHAGQTLAELKLAQLTGTRVVGIERNGEKIIAPSGLERLHAGDNVLVAGTLSEIKSFRRWLTGAPTPSGSAAPFRAA